MYSPLITAFIQPNGETHCDTSGGPLSDDSVLTRLCFAKSFGQQAARRSKSTAVWQVEGVAPRHLPPLPSLFYLCVVKGEMHSLRSPLTKLVPVSVLKKIPLTARHAEAHRSEARSEQHVEEAECPLGVHWATYART